MKDNTDTEKNTQFYKNIRNISDEKVSQLDPFSNKNQNKAP